MDNNTKESLRKEFNKWISKGWSDWLLLSNNNTVNLPEFPGVYKVRIKDREFPRLKGTTSIIYIGCTEKRGLKKRIKGLIGGRHVAKTRINRIKQTLQVELEFRFQVDLTAREKEAELLSNFQDNHLELPSCNHNITKQ